MGKGEIVTIEILATDSSRVTWWNEFVGETFEAEKVSMSTYSLTANGLASLKQKAGQVENIFSAMIHAEFACVYGEIVEKTNIPTFEMHPKNVNYLMEVRVFRVTEDFHLYDRTGTRIQSTPLKKGDLFEEEFNNPNHLVMIEGQSKRKRWHLPQINQSMHILPRFELEKTIDVKESVFFETQKKKLATAYKRTRTTIANANVKLNQLRFLLEIDDDE